ncbi:MAG: ABC transporter ATP-binding protein [Gemmatimonadetes bacterium]|nr:ABC transporter ATP-binding protein [Gemmatimonadota bacterium]
MTAVARTSIPTFAAALWRRRRRAIVASLVLLVLSSLSEGAGLLIVVPMLSLAGVPLGDGVMHAIAVRIGQAMAAVGLPLTLPSVLVTAVAILGVRTLLVQWESTRARRLALGVVAEERDRLFSAVVAMPWSRFVRLRGSDVVQALTVHTESVEFAVGELLRLLAEALTVLVTVVVAARVSWAVTALVGVTGVALLALLRVVRAPGRDESERAVARSESVFRMATDAVGGMKAVKGYGAEGRTVAAFAEANARLGDALRALDATRARAAVALGVGMAVALAVMVYVAVAAFHLAPAALLLLLAMYTRLVPRLASAQQAWQHLGESLASWDVVQRLRAECEREAATLAPAAPWRPSSAPAVRFERVTFRYDGAAGDALEGVTFDVPAGAMTAIVGPSGSGKTTAADVMAGLLEPASGRVLADGAPLDRRALPAWQATIGVLPQDVLLFPGTVRENLRWAAPLADDADLHRALEAASATFVRGWPAGLDTPVGDRGTLLSGGERQRIALARALLRRPALLVLDEATSALDAETEQGIVTALRALAPRPTIVIVSHRLSVVRAADHVVVLDGGAVVAEGRWEELAGSVPRVRELFAL